MLLVVFFASYLVEKRELLASRQPPARSHAPARPRAPRTARGAVGRLDPDHGAADRTSARHCCSSRCSSRCSTSPPTAPRTSRPALVMFVAAVVIAYKMFDHVAVRVDTWIDPWQATRRARATSSCRPLRVRQPAGSQGTGLGLGPPRSDPGRATDFIFAAIGEELGLIGTVAVVIAVPAARRRRVPDRDATPRGRSRSSSPPGSPTIIGVQTFVIIGGVTRLIPLTGVTLPFISYGGSSLVANFVILALLLRISDENATTPRPRPSRRRAGSRSRRLAREPGHPTSRHRGHRPHAAARRAAHLPADRRREQAGQGPAQHADLPQGRQPAPGRDHHRGRQGRRPLDPVEGRVQVPARVPATAGCSPRRRRLPVVRLRQHRRREHYSATSPAATARTCSLRNLGDLLSASSTTGNVVLSLRVDVQRMAKAALGTQARLRRGDSTSKTGAIIAMYSNPSFDPQPLAGHDTEGREARTGTCSTPTARPPTLLPRAYRERYPPGSTFKIVTTEVALDDRHRDPDDDVPVAAIAHTAADRQRRSRTSAARAAAGPSTRASSVLQHDVRPARPPARRPVRARHGQVRDRRRAAARPRRPARSASTGPAAGTFANNKPQFALAGDRPGRRGGHAAADGARRRGHGRTAA